MVVSTPGIVFRLLDGRQAAAQSGELLGLHGEVYGQAADGADLARQFRVWHRQPGFTLAQAWHGGFLVGYASGLPLRPSTSGWNDLTTPLPGATTAEYAGRTFALNELLVRASWRRQGIAGSLHDLILSGRTEERAALAVPPGATAAQIAFRNWGWRKVARSRAPQPGSPVLDVLVKQLPAGQA